MTDRRNFLRILSGSLATGFAITSSKALFAGLSMSQVTGSNYYGIEEKLADEFWNTLQAGKKVTDDIGSLHSDGQVQAALQNIAGPIMSSSTRKNLDWRIAVTTGNIVNACTPGGGVIMVNASLIKQCDNEAELASVIAHEVGHVEHRHQIQRLMSLNIMKSFGIKGAGQSAISVQTFNKLISNVAPIIHTSFKRLHEHQADAFIITAFRQTGYDMTQASLFFRKLKKIYPKTSSPGVCMFSTHPENDERIMRIDKLAKTYQARVNRYTISDSADFQLLKSRLS